MVIKRERDLEAEAFFEEFHARCPDRVRLNDLNHWEVKILDDNDTLEGTWYPVWQLEPSCFYWGKSPIVIAIALMENIPPDFKLPGFLKRHLLNAARLT